MAILGIEISHVAFTRGLAVAVIVVATLISTRVTGNLIRRWMAKTGAVPTTSIFVNITRVAVVIVGTGFVLSVLGISITPVLTALGVGGLAVALALQDTLGNLFAGLQIVASKQIRPGDYLLLDTTQEGTVVDIAWRTTTLRTQAGNLVIVPNAKLASAIVTNYQLPAGPLAVYIEFGVPYDADLARVEAVALEIGAEVMVEYQPELAVEPPIFRFRALADSSITCLLVLRVADYAEQHPLRSAFIRRLHERFAAEGMHFPFPTRTVHLIQE